MRTHRLPLILCFIALPIQVHAADAKSVEEALADIEAKAATIQTYSADVAMLMSMGSMSFGFDGKIRGKGEMYESTMAIDLFGQKMANRTVSGPDQIIWTEMDMMGEKMVTKATVGEMANALGEMAGGFGFSQLFTGTNTSPHPSALLKMYSESYDWADVEIRDLDGTRVYAFSGKSRDAGESEAETESDEEDFFMFAELMGGLGNMNIYVGEEDGFVRKVEMLNPSGMPIFTQTYSNITLNTPMDDSAFLYSPPDGVEVMDFAELSAGAGFDFGSGDSSADTSGYNTKFNVGDAAPEFEGVTSAGKPVKLSDYRGKVVLLDFWATWCGPCVAELPNVITAYNEFHSKGLEIVGISLDDDKAAFESFVRSHKGMDWIQIFDGKGWEAAIPALYGVDSIPLTLLLDKDGKIIAKDLRGDALNEAVAKALGEQ